MHRFKRASTPLAALLLLSACGMKGDLYIPQTPAAQQRATLPQVIGNSMKTSAPSDSQNKPRPEAATQTHPEHETSQP